MLLPDQIVTYWDLFKEQIERNPPPISDHGPYDINNILLSVLAGGMQAWILNEKDGESVGFVLTTILRDASGVSTLLIYNALILGPAKQSLWLNALETLVKYGKARGCSKISSFIANQKLIALFKEHGVSTEFVYINQSI